MGLLLMLGLFAFGYMFGYFCAMVDEADIKRKYFSYNYPKGGVIPEETLIRLKSNTRTTKTKTRSNKGKQSK